jgi:hypothetical protein
MSMKYPQAIIFMKNLLRYSVRKSSSQFRINCKSQFWKSNFIKIFKFNIKEEKIYNHLVK